MGGRDDGGVPLVIFRSGLRRMAGELKMERRAIHPVLGVPVPVAGETAKEKEIDEEKLPALLAEDYRINPGIFMSREDVLERFEVDGSAIDNALVALEEKGLVKLYRTKKGIELAKVTYEGAWTAPIRRNTTGGSRGGLRTEGGRGSFEGVIS